MIDSERNSPPQESVLRGDEPSASCGRNSEGEIENEYEVCDDALRWGNHKPIFIQEAGVIRGCKGENRNSPSPSEERNAYPLIFNGGIVKGKNKTES